MRTENLPDLTPFLHLKEISQISMPSCQMAIASQLQTPSLSSSADSPLFSKRIAFTTPLAYARRLAHLLTLKGSVPLSHPTVLIQTSPQTRASLAPFLLQPFHLHNTFSAIAFTSRNGIAAFSEALSEIPDPPLPDTGEDIFTVSALGKDADLLDPAFLSKLCKNSSRIRVLVPPVATPASLAKSLGAGCGRRVLCPVPLVVDLEEPPVIPEFLRALRSRGWVPVGVPAYETRWTGGGCAEALLEEEAVDGLVFTSSAEVEGLLKGLRGMGLGWEEVRRRWPRVVVAAHGPVTAAGAERLGVAIDVVSSRFGSFDGVVEALATNFRKLDGRR